MRGADDRGRVRVAAVGVVNHGSIGDVEGLNPFDTAA